MSYFYLMASLPALRFGDKPAQTAEQFLFHAEGVLTPPHLEELRVVLGGSPEAATTDAGRRWHGAETQLRNAVARARAGRWGVDARRYQRVHSGFEARIEQVVTEAFTRTDPLEREADLNRCRWQILDDLALADAFGWGAVLAHALKLRIAERQAGLDRARAEQRVEEFIAARQQSAAAGA